MGPKIAKYLGRGFTCSACGAIRASVRDAQKHSRVCTGGPPPPGTNTASANGPAEDPWVAVSGEEGWADSGDEQRLGGENYYVVYTGNPHSYVR